MTLEPGVSLAHYRLVEKIGEGGMGVVWSAEDKKLGRKVAIKLLPAEMASDPDRLARFEREARSLASLNHPNIALIHGLEEANGTRFLVLELVEGETLDLRIARGPAPVPEALEIARQIADALAAAHAAGILHRDLKPANVKRTPGGKVKVLDFGLAKPFLSGAASGDASATQSPTVTSFGDATQAGVLLGTAAYMSPEQARGHAVDRRADIWALGCVLYELLTGARLFGGGTISDTLASVLKEEPQWDALPADLPPAARRLLRRALAKDPDRRLHDVGDVRIEIDEALADRGEGAADAPLPQPSLVRRRLPWAIAAVAVAAAAWIGIVSTTREAHAPAARVVASIPVPAGMEFQASDGIALSPDGKRLLFPAREPGGTVRLWLRALDGREARPLDGTQGASSPFWSPDGQQIGFWTAGTVRKLDLRTGAVETLAEGEWEFGSGADWGSAGDVLLSRPWVGILRIAALGGEEVLVSDLDPDGTEAHLWPSFLPDGRHFLYLARTYGSEARTGEIRVGSLDGGPEKLLLRSNSLARYAWPGYLVWWHDGNLRAQRFDLEALELRGEPVILAPEVRFDPRDGRAAFTLSQSGVLVYQGGSEQVGDRLVWIDRQGNVEAEIGETGSHYGPRLSPDGARIAVDLSGQTNQGDIWLLDAARGSGLRLTAFPEDDSQPQWSPDGARVAFFSQKGGTREAVYVQPIHGGEASVLARDPEAGLSPLSWHGESLLLLRNNRETSDLWICSVPDGGLRPYLQTPFDEVDAAFSPDGRHVAYTSNESGRWEVYVGTFPEPGERWLVSRDGGSMPAWGPGGGELFYVSSDRKMMSVPVERSAGTLQLGEPRTLFPVDIKSHRRRQYDTRDGRRFLVNRMVRAGGTEPLTLVLGWDRGLGAGP